MIWNNTTLRNDLKAIVRRHPEIEDILLFGSSVKGKVHPSDSDILVLFKKKVDKDVEYEVRKKLEKYLPSISIISKTLNTVHDPSFDARESILFESISLLTGEDNTHQWGYSSFGLFKYSFEGWSKLQQTKFYHAFNGRDRKSGVALSLECIKLSNNLILVPKHQIHPLQEFLEHWKIHYRYIPILIPDRLKKKSLLEER